ncbi:LOW QUALITY PROTEIN: serine protease snake [Bactrocera neohumeralis]|uniref:LOW QUALITY PROTEIN: serine protease snake n=1 Tax=Bactrocera neohumeralis TaxID=98809 RepID=UPI0021669FA0|nr:LOW QUALITY PROTEIN: serine protease snake [Bactrocera neohumeralis]
MIFRDDTFGFFILCKTMFRLRFFDKLLILSLLFNLIAALGKPQMFQYYRSTKYTDSRRAGRKLFEKVPNGMNIFEMKPRPPKRETNLPKRHYYNVSKSANTATTVTTSKPLTTPQSIPFVDSDTYRLFGNIKNEIGVTVARPEGSLCRRSFDGRAGYCVLAYQCIHAVNNYRVHRSKLDVCSYRQSIPVICCPLFVKHVELKSPSARKCEQYNDVIEGVKFDLPRKFSGKTCVPSLPLIVGGEVTNEAEYPHMAALGWSQIGEDIRWGCGGTLISELYVLTAAHCATSNAKPPDVVRLGASNLNEISNELQDIKVAVIILHPKYKSFSHYHDIALIKLESSVKISSKVHPGCLWQLPHINIPTMVATGWGRTAFRGSRSDKLQKVELNMIDQNVCKRIYNKERRLPNGITDEQFCVGDMAGGKDTCQGDSGGPLHAELPELKCVKFIVGVTSFGKFCAKPNAPGVYTKVYPYLKWIESIAFKEN